MIAELDTSLTDTDFHRVCDVVYNHCGISLDEKKKELVRARIAKELRAGRFSSTREYLDHVTADPSSDAFTRFINAISTNLTSFFREKDHFDYLANTFLPEEIERKRQAGHGRLLAWSAACSTGEEPYTLAMTLLENLKGPTTWDMRILATDISTRVLDVARKGVYPAASVASIPDYYRTQYFAKTNAGGNSAQFAASPVLRDVIRFRYLNLMNPWPFSGPFDFIFCRNVMIYFDKETQEKLVNRFWNCLRPGGLLFTGHSESLMGIKHRFANCKPSIYAKS